MIRAEVTLNAGTPMAVSVAMVTDKEPTAELLEDLAAAASESAMHTYESQRNLGQRGPDMRTFGEDE